MATKNAREGAKGGEQRRDGGAKIFNRKEHPSFASGLPWRTGRRTQRNAGWQRLVGSETILLDREALARLSPRHEKKSVRGSRDGLGGLQSNSCPPITMRSIELISVLALNLMTVCVMALPTGGASVAQPRPNETYTHAPSGSSSAVRLHFTCSVSNRFEILVLGIDEPSLVAEIEETIRTGDVVSDLAKPFSYVGFWLARDFGRAAYFVVFRALPILLVGQVLNGLHWPSSVGAWLVFGLAMGLALLRQLVAALRRLLRLWPCLLRSVFLLLVARICNS